VTESTGVWLDIDEVSLIIVTPRGVPILGVISNTNTAVEADPSTLAAYNRLPGYLTSLELPDPFLRVRDMFGLGIAGPGTVALRVFSIGPCQDYFHCLGGESGASDNRYGGHIGARSDSEGHPFHLGADTDEEQTVTAVISSLSSNVCT
jgi:hypothetical protein